MYVLTNLTDMLAYTKVTLGMYILIKLTKHDIGLYFGATWNVCCDWN
jgi:hypothetical protein